MCEVDKVRRECHIRWFDETFGSGDEDDDDVDEDDYDHMDYSGSSWIVQVHLVMGERVSWSSPSVVAASVVMLVCSSDLIHARIAYM